MHFSFAESAKRDIEKLPKKVRLGLREKLLYWQSLEKPLEHAQPLTQHTEATHRFLYGVYRILIKQFCSESRILRIRHRKDVYR
jgi:mRNA-degrading endonuclease RelE of RelBE toxin-antitoxin system